MSAHIMVEMEWAIRYDGVFEETLDMYRWLNERCDVLVVYQHPEQENKRAHCHALIRTTTTAKSVREAIRRITTYKGYCMEAKSMVKYLSYMSKGLYDPKFNKGVPDGIINNAKAMGYAKETKSERTGSDTEQGTAESVPKEPKYLVSHLQNECVAECGYIRSENLEYEYRTVERVFNTCIDMSIKRTEERKFKGRIHNKFIREVAEHVLCWYFPGATGTNLAFNFWKFNQRG